LEVLKAIRTAEEAVGIGGLGGVKIIMATALSGSHDVLRAGCEAYLIKPIDSSELLNNL